MQKKMIGMAATCRRVKQDAYRRCFENTSVNQRVDWYVRRRVLAAHLCRKHENSWSECGDLGWDENYESSTKKLW